MIQAITSKITWCWKINIDPLKMPNVKMDGLDCFLTLFNTMKNVKSYNKSEKVFFFRYVLFFLLQILICHMFLSVYGYVKQGC